MHSIDEFYERLSWGSQPEVQKAAVEEARSIQSLWLFVLPGYRKDIWENCARILAERSDEELEPYLYPILKWMQDMNWPGAFIIFDRLQRMPESRLSYGLRLRRQEAVKLEDDVWLENLDELERAVRSEG